MTHYTELEPEYKAEPRERYITTKDLRHEVLTARKSIVNLLNCPEAFQLNPYDKTVFVVALYKLKEIRKAIDFVNKSEELSNICGKFIECRND